MKMIEYYYCVSFSSLQGASVLILLLAPLVACINTSAMATSVNNAHFWFFPHRAKSERPFDFIYERKLSINLPVVKAYVRSLARLLLIHSPFCVPTEQAGCEEEESKLENVSHLEAIDT
jgi:hypothetical protein